MQYPEEEKEKKIVISESEKKTDTTLSNAEGDKGPSSDIHQLVLDPNTNKEELYKIWASDYDRDILSCGYCGHIAVAEKLKKIYPTAKKILDAGCGTGLILPEIKRVFGDNIECEGCDLSQEMLDIAAKREGYTKLKK